MEETLLELQYLAIMQLCGDNSAEFPSREQVFQKIKDMTTQGEHMSLLVQ